MHDIIGSRVNWFHFHAWNGIGLTVGVAEKWETVEDGPVKRDSETAGRGRLQMFHGYAVGMAVCCKDDAGGTKAEGRNQALPRLKTALRVGPISFNGMAIFETPEELKSFIDSLRDIEHSKWSDKRKHREYVRAFSGMEVSRPPQAVASID